MCDEKTKMVSLAEASRQYQAKLGESVEQSLQKALDTGVHIEDPENYKQYCHYKFAMEQPDLPYDDTNVYRLITTDYHSLDGVHAKGDLLYAVVNGAQYDIHTQSITRSSLRIGRSLVLADNSRIEKDCIAAGAEQNCILVLQVGSTIGGCIKGFVAVYQFDTLDECIACVKEYHTLRVYRDEFTSKYKDREHLLRKICE